ncbi:hypothetical protein LTR86_000723 [Recurvomyces mirabilis]|nr:hypothetical protein LTR86_000723 [Recurvomyces mirabilis]
MYSQRALITSMTRTANFVIKTYQFPGQHMREYAGATRSGEDDTLYLEANQYIPCSNPEPEAGDVTILALQAIGFPKEIYEPVFDHLLEASTQHSWRIRSIWIADASVQGASGLLNEQTQGDEPSSFDYARDMLHMINVFREDFVQPIVGIGHSMGATTLIQLSTMHPRLLANLVLFDPIIGFAGPEFSGMFYHNSIRDDIWSSREEAEDHFRKAWRKWDPQVVDLWMKYGLRDTPTTMHPEPGKVTLTTSKAQEGWLYSRPAFGLDLDGNATIAAVSFLQQAKYPDMNDTILTMHPFYRPEDGPVWSNLVHVRPSVLYVFPSKGPGSRVTQAKVERTGTGKGGSGGMKAGRVAQETVDGVGHHLPFEKPQKCATIASSWIGRDLAKWRECRRHAEEHADDKSIDKLALSEEWKRGAREVYLRSKAGRQAKL